MKRTKPCHITSSLSQALHSHLRSDKRGITFIFVTLCFILIHVQVAVAQAGCSLMPTPDDHDPRNILPLEVVQRILSMPPPFINATHAKDCEALIGELNEQDLDGAARTSYVFWVAATTFPNIITPEMRQRAALKEARRHYFGEGKEYDKALLSLRNTIDFRKDKQLDLVRTCMQPNYPYANDKEATLAARYREYINLEAKHQTTIVRGHDKMFRCILLKLERRSTQTDEEAYFIANLYMVERAIATTEVLTEGTEETCVGIFDFGTYLAANAPPRHAMKAVMVSLQRHYPERLHSLLILDPPFWMRAFYAVLRVFISGDTTAKITMVSGVEQKEQVLGSIIDVDQAMPFMLPGGKLNSPANMERFLNEIPFHCLYDGLLEAKQVLIQ